MHIICHLYSSLHNIRAYTPIERRSKGLQREMQLNKQLESYWLPGPFFKRLALEASNPSYLM